MLFSISGILKVAAHYFMKSRSRDGLAAKGLFLLSLCIWLFYRMMSQISPKQRRNWQRRDLTWILLNQGMIKFVIFCQASSISEKTLPINGISWNKTGLDPSEQRKWAKEVTCLWGNCTCPGQPDGFFFKSWGDKHYNRGLVCAAWHLIYRFRPP